MVASILGACKGSLNRGHFDVSSEMSSAPSSSLFLFNAKLVALLNCHEYHYMQHMNTCCCYRFIVLCGKFIGVSLIGEKIIVVF